MEENKPKKLDNLWKAGCSLMVSALFIGPFMANIYREKQDKQDDKMGRQEYNVLLNLADVDRDGHLSDIEKSLLCSRMDQNIANTDYLGGGDYAKWSHYMTNPPAFFGGGLKVRIEKAISMYSLDKDR